LQKGVKDKRCGAGGSLPAASEKNHSAHRRGKKNIKESGSKWVIKDNFEGEISGVPVVTLGRLLRAECLVYLGYNEKPTHDRESPATSPSPPVEVMGSRENSD